MGLFFDGAIRNLSARAFDTQSLNAQEIEERAITEAAIRVIAEAVKPWPGEPIDPIEELARLIGEAQDADSTGRRAI